MGQIRKELSPTRVLCAVHNLHACLLGVSSFKKKKNERTEAQGDC